MSTKRQKHLQAEFSRQASQMASAPAFHAEAALSRLVKAVGESAPDAVLDLACGPGIVAQAISPHVRQVIGIDATSEMIRLARERLENTQPMNAHFGVALAERLPFEASWFDLVVTRLAFHHFVNVGAVLSEIRRVLQPAGRLIIADVIASEEPEEAALHNSLEKLRDPTHVHMFPGSHLLELLRIEGFKVVHHESWMQGRAFPEWASIIADPVRTEPLESVMRALAQAGLDAGISLREESGELRFTHTWMLVIAKPQ